MTTQSSLTSFITDLGNGDALKVEQDFGSGYVKLRTSEAERRQAAQDIKSSEDIVLELLRNSRDAHAKNIFVAISSDDSYRSITVIDDGDGIPEWMHERIFDSRVTSKLDSAHQDKWGFHGRGMALYSIRENSLSSKILRSTPEHGCSIQIKTDRRQLPEKKDQSTFPKFVEDDGVQSMRGPRNILRTIAEFAIEHREDATIMCGSPAEIASAMLEHATMTMPTSIRIFDTDESAVDLTVVLGLSHDPKSFATAASSLGLDISERTARRILDEDIEPARDMLYRIRTESFGHDAQESSDDISHQRNGKNSKNPSSVSFSKEDIDDFRARVSEAFTELAEKYYLKDEEPMITRRRGSLHIEFELSEGEN